MFLIPGSPEAHLCVYRDPARSDFLLRSLLSAAPPQGIIFPYSEPPLDAWRIQAQPARVRTRVYFPRTAEVTYLTLQAPTALWFAFLGNSTLHNPWDLALAPALASSLILSILLGIQRRLFPNRETWVKEPVPPSLVLIDGLDQREQCPEVALQG